jgi:hypothetical protein
VKPEESTCTVDLLIVGAIAVIEALTVAAIALALTLLSYARPAGVWLTAGLGGAPPPFVHPLYDHLQPLTCAELRLLSGSRSRTSKLHLQAALIA